MDTARRSLNSAAGQDAPRKAPDSECPTRQPHTHFPSVPGARETKGSNRGASLGGELRVPSGGRGDTGGRAVQAAGERGCEEGRHAEGETTPAVRTDPRHGGGDRVSQGSRRAVALAMTVGDGWGKRAGRQEQRKQNQPAGQGSPSTASAPSSQPRRAQEPAFSPRWPGSTPAKLWLGG